MSEPVRYVKKRKYVDKSVLDAARERIAHIFDTHDKVVVMFSGGKDSLAVLYLVKEYHEKHGLGKVEAIFRDEEVIPFTVRRFLEDMRKEPWLNLRWTCYPMQSEKYVLGKYIGYVQWDPARAGNYVTNMPEWAERPAPGDTRIYDQWTMDEELSKPYKGKVCFLTGIRCAESLTRYRAIVNKLDEPWVAASSSKRVALGRPIYDWSENDIFKFFHDFGIRYCDVYEAQRLAGMRLRVATPMIANSAKVFGELRAMEPDFYDAVVAVFPEMVLQERYYSELALRSTKDAPQEYAVSFAKMHDYIDTFMNPELQAKAHKMLSVCEKLAESSPEAYPLHHVWKLLITGNIRKYPMPYQGADRTDLAPKSKKKG